MRYRFLEFVLDTEQQSLSRSGSVVPLRRQTYRVLLHLLERAPAVVGKDELLDAVWGHQALSPGVVAQSIRELRDGLDDVADQPRAILTKHRVGYQFIAPVLREAPGGLPGHDVGPTASVPSTEAASGTAQHALPAFARPADAASSRRGGAAWPWLVAAAILMAAVAAIAVWSQRESAAPERGWPDDAAALHEARQALEATRRFEYRTALRSLARARSRQDTPRTALLEARLRLAMGEHAPAQRILATLKAGEGALARRDQLLLEAVQHELDGRYSAALDRYRILAELDTGDTDILLALFELQYHERDGGLAATYQRLANDAAIPVERKLLLSAQLAGTGGEPALQATQAEAALASAARWPALAAFADVERARARRGQGRIDDALDGFERAAAVLEREGLLRAAVDVWLDRADAVMGQGDLDAVAQRLTAIDRRFEAGGDAYMRGRILHARGRIAARSGRDDEALGLFAAAIRQHEAAGNTDGIASALSAQGGPLRRLGRAAEARAALERALLLAEQSGTDSIQAGVHGNLANLHATESRFDDAVRHYEAALALFRRTHDRRQEAVTLGNLANLAAIRGEARGVDDLNRQALAIFRELGMVPDVARTLLNLAAGALDRGDLDAAAQLAQESVDLYRGLPHPSRTARALALLADVSLHAADVPAAGALLEEANTPGEPDAPTAAILATLAGRIAQLRGDADAARAAYERALSLRETLHDRSMMRASRLDLAYLELHDGRPVAAEQAALAVAAEAKADAGAADERRARLVVAEAQLEQGRAADAERELAQVRTLLDGAPSFDDEMQWALLRARLDREPHDRRERLRWIQAQADERGQRLLALKVRGEMLAFEPAAAAAAWQAEIERLELAALAGARVTIRP